MESSEDVPITGQKERAGGFISLRLLRPRQRIILAAVTGARVVVGICDLLLAAAMYLLFIVLQGRATVHAFGWHPKSALSLAMFAAVLVILRALLDISSSRSAFRHVQALSSDFLLRLTRGYSEMDWRRFVERNRGELTGHAVYTAREAADFYHRCMELISGMAIIALMTAALVYQSPRAAAVFGCALALFYATHRLFIRNGITRAASDREGALRVLQRELANFFLSGKEIRTYGNYGFFHERIRRQAEQVATGNQRVVFLPQVSRALADQGAMLLFLAVIIAVEARAGDTQHLVAVLAFYFVLSRRLLPLITQLSMIVGQMQGSFENVRVLNAELQQCRRYAREIHAPQLPTEGKALELKKTSFWYSQADPILRGVNLSVTEGEIIVVCGASGAGKSSLLNLIAGVLAPQEGTICVDRRALAYVPQEVPLLDASIRENLTFGLDRKDDAQLRRALQVAQLDEFVRSLPRGLDTPAGDNGALFSGGERQRLGIARAILRGSRLLLLDEATSALDQNTEEQVLRNLRISRATILLATHRIHNRTFADRVLRLQAGRLIEDPLHRHAVRAMSAGVR